MFITRHGYTEPLRAKELDPTCMRCPNTMQIPLANYSPVMGPQRTTTLWLFEPQLDQADSEQSTTSPMEYTDTKKETGEKVDQVQGQLHE